MAFADLLYFIYCFGENYFNPFCTNFDTEETLRIFFRLMTGKLDADFRYGLRLVARLIVNHNNLFISITAMAFVTAVIEGTSIGSLGLAANTLAGRGEIEIPETVTTVFPVLSEWITERTRTTLFLLLVLFAVIMQIIKSGLEYFNKRLDVLLQYRASRQMAETTTNHVMSLSYSEISRYPSGYIQSLIAQSRTISAWMSMVHKVVTSACFFLIYLGMMIAVSLQFALMSLLVLLILSIGLTSTVKKIREIGNRMAVTELNTGRITVEFLQALRLIHVFGATQEAVKNINEARGQHLQAAADSKIIQAMVSPAIDSIIMIGAGCLLVIGYLWGQSDSAKMIGTLMMFFIILMRMVPRFKSLNDARLSFAHNLPVLTRVAGFLRAEGKSFLRTCGEKFQGLSNSVVLEDVSFQYGLGSKLVLENISFTIDKGTTTALIGPSGAGKSTMVDLLLGLNSPTSGRILVDGSDLEVIDPNDWISRIGCVDQDVFLFNKSIEENIRYTQNSATPNQIQDAAIKAHAHEFIKDLPNGYNTVIGERGYQLSAGQRQRLALARALLRKPDILVLDEATSALDTESERLIQATLKELHSEATIILIAHRLSTIESADKIVVLNQGSIIESGTKSDLMEKGDYFQRVWRMQTGEDQ